MKLYGLRKDGHTAYVIKEQIDYMTERGWKVTGEVIKPKDKL